MKKLRYAVEFFESLYDDKAVKHYLQHCKDAQEVLGDMNDATAAANLSLQMGNLPGADRLHDWAEQRQARSIEQLGTVISEFRAAKAFWH
jgi:CHAD domain-containing protein